MKRTIFIIAAAITALAILAVGCGDSSVNSGGESKYLNMFLDVFSKNPGQNNDTGGTPATNATYTLTVNVTPSNSGTVSRNPSGTSYTAGSQVTVTATESNGYKFTGWTGASNDTTATVTIIMDGNQTLTANFISTAVATYTLTVNVAPTGGGIVSREPNKTRYNAGEVVVMTAEAASGYTFTGWTGDMNETKTSVTVTMNGNITLTANFQQNTYTLSVNASPTLGGTIHREPNKAVYTYGEQVTVTATPASGYTFKNWSSTSSFSVTNSVATVTMYGNITITANFQPPTTTKTYTLTTEVSPTGGGSVSRSPNQSSYTSGTSVTVTATAASGYTFTGWSGAASGTANPMAITMNGDRTLTANFQQQNVTPPDGGDYNYALSCGTRPCEKVVIGGKTWMAENLNYETTNSWCYDNDPANCEKYGRLYTWEAAKTACQSVGWRLPTREDWNALVTAAGGPNTAGSKLKSTSGWNSFGSIGSTDEFGFSALPAGSRNTGGSFVGAGNHCVWWTATEYGSGRAYNRGMFYGLDDVGEGNNGLGDGFSARCVQDN